MVFVQFCRPGETIDQVKTSRMPNVSWRTFFRLNNVPRPFWYLCVRLKPDELVVRLEIEPLLIQRHYIVPRSDSLLVQHP
jgi:hypothetical protein